MSEREYKRVTRQLKPFLTLFIVVMGTAFLASCGGGGSSDPTATSATVDGPTMTAQAVSGSTTVPGTWKGRAPLPNLQAPNPEKTAIIDGGRVSSEIIIAAYDKINENQVQGLLVSNSLSIVARTDNFVQIRVSNATPAQLKEKISVLKTSGLFKYVGYDRVFAPGTFSNPDPSLADGIKYWNYDSIRARQAWELVSSTYNPVRIKVGVSDDGFSSYTIGEVELMAIYSPYSRQKCDSWYSLVNCEDHSYHVSGIIGATGNDGIGHVGIGSGSTNLVSLYGANSNGSGVHILGFQELLSSAVRVINYSMWIGTIPDSATSATDEQVSSAKESSIDSGLLIGTSIDDFFDKRLAANLDKPDALIVQISGNAGKALMSDGKKANSELAGLYNGYLVHAKNSKYYTYVADRIIIAGAYGRDRKISDFTMIPISVEGLNRFLLAPGEGIYSTVRGGLAQMSGTSQAAPHIAGAAALILEANPGLTAAEVQDILLKKADTNLGKPFEKRTDGDGSSQYRYLNVEAAVKEAIRLKNERNCSTASVTTPVVDSQIGAVEYIVAPWQSLNLSTTSSISPSASYPITGYQWRKGSTGAVVAGQNALSATITFDAASTETVSVAPILKDGTVCTKSSKSISITVSQYSKISNAGALVVSSTPAGYGPGDFGCIRDNMNGYYYEAKMPGGMRAASRRFTNYTNTTTIQKYDNGIFTYATPADVDSPDNAITYVRSFRTSAVCGRTNWDMIGIATWNFPFQMINADMISVWNGDDGRMYCPYGGCSGDTYPPMSAQAGYSPIPYFPQYGYYNITRSSGLGLILASPPQ